MDPLKRLFGEYTRDLAPGTPNPSQVVRERILYRSARDKSIPPLKAFEGDSMNPDLNDFTLPVDSPSMAQPSPKAKTPGKKPEPDGLEELGGSKGPEKFPGIESFKSLESTPPEEPDKKKDKKKDGIMNFDIMNVMDDKEDKKNKKQQEVDDDFNLMNVLTEDEEEKENREEEEEDEDGGMMSLGSMEMGALR